MQKTETDLNTLLVLLGTAQVQIYNLSRHVQQLQEQNKLLVTALEEARAHAKPKSDAALKKVAPTG